MLILLKKYASTICFQMLHFCVNFYIILYLRYFLTYSSSIKLKQKMNLDESFRTREMCSI